MIIDSDDISLPINADPEDSGVMNEPQGPNDLGVGDGPQWNQQTPGLGNDPQHVPQDQGVVSEDPEPVTKED